MFLQVTVVGHKEFVVFAHVGFQDSRHAFLVDPEVGVPGLVAAWGEGEDGLRARGDPVKPDFRHVVQAEVLDQHVDLVVFVGEDNAVELVLAGAGPRNVEGHGLPVLGHRDRAVPGPLDAEVHFEGLLRHVLRQARLEVHGNKLGGLAVDANFGNPDEEIRRTVVGRLDGDLDGPIEVEVVVGDDDLAVVGDFAEPVAGGELRLDTENEVVPLADAVELLRQLGARRKVHGDGVVFHADKVELSVRDLVAEGLDDALAVVRVGPNDHVREEEIRGDKHLPHLVEPVVGHNELASEGHRAQGLPEQILAKVDLDRSGVLLHAEVVRQILGKNVLETQLHRLLVLLDEQLGFVVVEEAAPEQVPGVELEGFVHLGGDVELGEPVDQLAGEHVPQVGPDDGVLVLDRSDFNVRRRGGDEELVLLEPRDPEVRVVRVELRQLELHRLGPVQPDAVRAGGVADAGGQVPVSLSLDRGDVVEHGDAPAHDGVRHVRRVVDEGLPDQILFVVRDGTDGVLEVVGRGDGVHRDATVDGDRDAFVNGFILEIEVDDLRLVLGVGPSVLGDKERRLKHAVQELCVHREVSLVVDGLQLHLNALRPVSHVNDAVRVKQVHDAHLRVATTVDEETVRTTGGNDVLVPLLVLRGKVQEHGSRVLPPVHAVIPHHWDERGLENAPDVGSGVHVPTVVHVLKVPDENVVVRQHQDLLATLDGSNFLAPIAKVTVHKGAVRNSAFRPVVVPFKGLRTNVEIHVFVLEVHVSPGLANHKSLPDGDAVVHRLHLHDVEKPLLVGHGLHGRFGDRVLLQAVNGDSPHFDVLGRQQGHGTVTVKDVADALAGAHHDRVGGVGLDVAGVVRRPLNRYVDRHKLDAF
ncbi:YceI family protein [Babesia caballi]|uniref:YceI family protein n=1 Tax=Babesia caballi TaxID=5871 RepID=A0AAV4LSQ3_BABCB|nr:YceI family protein [Babesia caballi]